ncbi:MAG: DNA/RNA non-specific endonuclease [Pseudomonadota bacterium]
MLPSSVTAAFLSLLELLGGAPNSTQSSHHYFADNKAPIVVRQVLQDKTRQLHFEGFAVLHSGVSRTPLWSAEHLTTQRLHAARELKRKNTYHAQPNLPAEERAELDDYTRSGYDRGHMSPAGDMPDADSQYESFSLANIIPQHPKNNQILWQGIEDATRNIVMGSGELYVVTGPLFEGEQLQRLNGRILVPTAVFKAIYHPARGQAGAYVTANAPGLVYQTLSIAELEARSGINLFPSLSEEIKRRKMQLPVPTPYNGRGRNKPVEAEFLAD